MRRAHKTFVATLAVALVIGFTLGAFAAGRVERAPVAAAPETPLPPGFGGVGGCGCAPFEVFFGEEFYKRFFGDIPERIPQRSLGAASSFPQKSSLR